MSGDEAIRCKNKNEPYEPVFDLSYSSFDLELSISGKAIKFMLQDPTEVLRRVKSFKSAIPEHVLDKIRDFVTDSGFADTHFKFVGRQIHYFLLERGVKGKIRTDFQADLQLIDESLVNGFQKLWLYQFRALQRLSWPLMIHDLDKNFTLDLTSMATRMLKRWTRLTKTIEVGILYRSKENFGLGLTPVVDHYKRMQLVKEQLLKNSFSRDIREIVQARIKREAKPGRKWRVSRLATKVEAEVDLQLRFPRQATREGLGAGNFKAKPSLVEKRKIISGTASQFAEHERIVHSHNLAMQGVWLGWKETVSPFNLSWKNLIHKLSPHLVRFILKTSVNWIRTPDLLKLWGLVPDAACKLCKDPQCTIHHILVGCKFALRDTRYTWRHDSVLYAIRQSLSAHIGVHNSKPQSHRPPHILASFVRKGEKSTLRAAEKQARRSLLDGAYDWKCIVDFTHRNIVFPPEIWATPQRPGIVVWSESLKKVYIIELTCPAEEGINNAAVRKQVRYDELKTSINSRTVWTATVITIEAGARGFVGFSMRRFLSSMGFKSRANSKLCNTISNVAAHCSYAIYLASSTVQWDRKKPLLSLEDESRPLLAA